VQDDIRWAKDTGIEHLPSKSYGINQPWCGRHDCDWSAVLAAAAAVPSRALAKAEPRTLRNRLLHTAVRLVRGQRKRKIKIPRPGPGP